MDVILTIVLIVACSMLTIWLYARSVRNGGYDLHNIGNHMGSRHWNKLNRFEGED